MSRPRRYAERTRVPVSRTMGEIDRLLQRHGAAQRGVMGAPNKERAVVLFSLRGRHVRLELRCPADDPAEERRVWRAILLRLKSRLECIADEMGTVESEFLDGIVLPNGMTCGQWLAARLDEAYASGKMPPLLPVARLEP